MPRHGVSLAVCLEVMLRMTESKCEHLHSLTIIPHLRSQDSISGIILDSLGQYLEDFKMFDE